MSEHTSDTILNGRLRVIQPRRGYRFSLDAILLARFIRPKAGARILELGAGCGVISILAAALYAPCEVVAVEIEEEMARLIERNAELNQLPAVRAVAADLRVRAIAGLGDFDLAVANPPYRAAGSGRRSPHPGRELARAEGGAGLHDFVAAAARYLKHGARAAFVFNASRGAELLSELRAARLEPKRLRMVHPRRELPATTILVEARKGGGVEMVVEPSLFVYDSEGVYSREVYAMLNEPSRLKEFEMQSAAGKPAISKF